MVDHGNEKTSCFINSSCDLMETKIFPEESLVPTLSTEEADYLNRRVSINGPFSSLTLVDTKTKSTLEI